MGIKYNNLKNVKSVSQNASSSTTITWIAPDEGVIGLYAGGSSVDIQFYVRVVNGPEPTFSVIDGELPLGLTLDSDSGKLSGIIGNVTQTFNFTIEASSNGASISRAFSVNVGENRAPVWVTESGSIGSQFEGTNVNVVIQATDPDNDPVTYNIISGSLPVGISLNSTTGVITGSLSSVTGNTTYYFTVRASDGALYTDRSFNFTVKYNAPPVWVTPTGNLGSFLEGKTFSKQFEATDATFGQNITYSLVNPASIPSGLHFYSNGLMQGTLDLVTTGTFKRYDFSINASDGLKTTYNNFFLVVDKNVAPQWVSSGTVINDLGGKFASTYLVATDNYEEVTYSLANSSSLPNDFQIYSNGLLAGTIPAVSSQTDYNFVARASDESGLSSNRSLKIVALAYIAPSWITGSDLGSELEQKTFTRNISVSYDPSYTVTYQLKAGSTLPSGMTFNNGLLSGTLPSYNTSTPSYSFTVQATDGVTTIERTFTFSVLDNLPVTVTNSVVNIETLCKVVINYPLEFADPENDNITYNVESGTLPTGLSIISGSIMGIPAEVTEVTNSTVVISGTDGFNNAITKTVNFSIKPNLPPVWVTPANENLYTGNEGNSFSYQLNAYDPEGNQVLFYRKPPVDSIWYSVTANGLVSGVLPLVSSDTDFSITIYTNDGSALPVQGVNPDPLNVNIRSFKVTSLFTDAPAFTTSSDLGGDVEGYSFIRTIGAINTGNNGITFSLANGTSLPNGMSMLANGYVYGSLPVATTSSDTYEFDVKADNGLKATYRTFSFVSNKNVAPVWITNAGTLGSFFANSSISTSVVASDPNGKPITYSLANSTTLPSDLTLSASGQLSGVLRNLVDEEVTTSFDVAVTDGVFTSYRTFSITKYADNYPVWATANALGSLKEGTSGTFEFYATDSEDSVLRYDIVSYGNLPIANSTFYTSSNRAYMSFSAPAVDELTNYYFTANATDSAGHVIEKTFNFNVTVNQPVTWVTNAGSIGSFLSGYAAPEFNVSATSDDGVVYSLVSGSLPTGYLFDIFTGSIYKQPPLPKFPPLATDTTFTFTIRASDGYNPPVDRTFSITALANLAPVWVTPAGSIGTFNENENLSFKLEGYDPENYANAFLLSSGSLPNGVTLASNGMLSGKIGSVTQDTVYNFTVTLRDTPANAAESTANEVQRSFSTLIKFVSPPSWVTPSGSLGELLEQSEFTANVVAISNGVSDNITYSLVNGSLPSGVSLNNATGQISGILPLVNSDTTYSFDITATDSVSTKSSTRTFSITTYNNVAPVWNTPEGSIFTGLERDAVNVAVSATDPNGQTVTYIKVEDNLPSTLTFFESNARLIGYLPNVENTTTYYLTVGAFDGTIRTDRTFTVTAQYASPPTWITNAGLLANAVGSEESIISNVFVSAFDTLSTGSMTYFTNAISSNSVTLLSNGMITGSYGTTIENISVTAYAVDGRFKSTGNRTFTLTPTVDAPSSEISSIHKVGARLNKNYVISDHGSANMIVATNLSFQGMFSPQMLPFTNGGTLSIVPDPLNVVTDKVLYANNCNFGYPTNLGSYANMTFEIWGRLATGTTTGTWYIFGASATNDTNPGMRLSYAIASSVLTLAFEGASSSITLTSGFDPYAWNHFAMVKDGTQLRLYINGILVGSTTVPQVLTNPSKFGSLYMNSFFAEYYFTGQRPVYYHALNIWNAAIYKNNFVIDINDYVAPVVLSNSSTTQYEFSNYSLTPTVGYFGSNSSLTYTIVPGSSVNNATVLANGFVYGTTPSFGNTAVTTIDITDSKQRKTRFSYTVNSLDTSPVWTNVSNSLSGSNTVATSFTLTATSPVSNPITFSIANGSLPNGLSLISNGFVSGTIDAPVGTYVFTARATDTVTTKGTNRVFDYTVVPPTDAYGKFVAAIMNFNTDTSNTTTLISREVTRQLPITQYTTSTTSAIYQTTEKKFGTGAAYFDGTNGLRIQNMDTLVGDFTIEMWIRPTQYKTNGVGIINNYSAGASANKFYLWLSGSGVIGLDGYNNSSTFTQVLGSGTTILTLNNWHHVAVVRTGADWKVYVNGNLEINRVGWNSANIAPNSTYWGLASFNASTFSEGMIGYMDDLRITNGYARYTSTFTAPSIPADTTFLADVDPYWANVTHMLPMNQNVGSVPVEVKNGYTVSKWTTSGTTGLISNAQSKWGTVSYYNTPNSSTTQFTRVAGATGMSADFTVECWVYFTSFQQFNAVITNYVSTSANNNFFLCVTNTLSSAGDLGGYKLSLRNSNSGLGNFAGTTTVNLNQWYHIAATRQGNTMRLFLNGNLEATSTNSSWAAGNLIGAQSTFWSIGGYENTPASWNTIGYIEDVRITAGVARYTISAPAPIYKLPFKQSVPIWTTSNAITYRVSTLINNRLGFTATSLTNTAITYSLSSGTLPTGTTLNSSNGVLTGTASATGSFTATLRVTDADGDMANSTFLINSVANADTYWNETTVLVYAGANASIPTNLKVGNAVTQTVASNGLSDSAVQLFGANTISFNPATNGYLTVPNQPFAGDFTIEGWFNVNTLTGRYSTIVSNRVTTTATGLEYVVGVRDDGTGARGLYLYQNNAFRIASGAGTVAINTWNHFVLMRIGTTIYLYLNGSLVPTTYTASGTMGFTGIGGFSAINEMFSGNLADIRVTTTARYPGAPATITVPTTRSMTLDIAPVYSPSSRNITVYTNSSTPISLTANSVDPLTYTVTSGAVPAGMTLNSNGVLTGTSTETVGTSTTFTVTANNTIKTASLTVIANTATL